MNDEIRTEEIHVADKRASDSHSITKHFAELADETTTLFRKEVELARAEISENLKQAQKGMAMLATSGAVLFAGMLVVLAAVTFFIGVWLPLWLSALIVGVGTLLAGWALYSRGKDDVKPREMVPRRTIHSVRETRNLAMESAT